VPSAIAYLQGRDIGEVSLTPCTENATTGELTPVTGDKIILRGTYEDLEISIDTETERIEGSTATRQNNVIICDGVKISLSEILYRGPDPSLVINVVFNYGVFLFKGVFSGMQFTGYFRRGPSSFSGTGKGKKLARLDLLSMDVGADSFKWEAVP
jgi:hypothetical protein